MLRQRLSRDGRFVNRSRTSRGEGGSAILPRSMWGLVNGPATPSTVREEELKAVSYRFPITSDPIAMQDPNRQRAPRYAATGEIENMFAEVLEVAQGTLDLAVLHRIAQYRIPAMQKITVQSSDALAAENGAPFEYASEEMSVEDQVALDLEDTDMEDVEQLYEHISGLSQRQKRKWAKEHPNLIKKLLERNPSFRKA